MSNVANYLDAVALSLTFSLREPVPPADLGFDDKQTEEFRKFRWLTRRRERSEELAVDE